MACRLKPVAPEHSIGIHVKDQSSNDRLADELAIHNLVSRYADAIVRRDAEAWGATWAEDAEWHIFGGVITGRIAIVEKWQKFISRLPFIHQQASGGLVSFPAEAESDVASARWYVNEWGVNESGPGMLTLGVYHDDYVREGTDWQFQRRVFSPLYMGHPDLSGTPHQFPTDV